MKHTYRLLLFSLITLSFNNNLFAKNKVFKKPLSELEQNEITHNTNEMYIYLGKDASNIEKTITHLCKLDTTIDSPIAALKKHLDDGFVIGLYIDIVDTFHYITLFLEQQKNTRSKEVKELRKQVEIILEQIDNDELTINPIKRNRSNDIQETRCRVGCNHEKDNKHCGRHDLTCNQEAHCHKKKKHHHCHKKDKHTNCKKKHTIDTKLEVLCDTKLDKELTVKDDAHFKDNIILKKSLYMQNSLNSKIGNVFKHKRRFIHNFGCNNTFVGVEAGNFCMQGKDNSGFGVQTLAVNKNGNDNTAVGSQALTFNTNGNSNVAVGARSMEANTTGSDNVALGLDTLRANVTGHGNTAAGNKALENNNGMNNCAFGRNALAANTTGEANIAVGSFALSSNTTGEFNIAIGSQAMQNNRFGEHNVAIGSQALRLNTTGIDNIAIGGHTLFANRVNGNVAIGNRALNATTTGNNNVAVGRNVLTLNTTGDENTAVGNYAMESNTTGRLNVAVGRSALRNCTTGSTNIAVGLGAGINLTTGNNNIYIDNDGLSTEHNAIRIGTDGKQNKCFIQGIFQNQFGSAQTDVQVEVGTGKLGIQTSSAQFKDNIEELSADYSHKLHELQPVSFTYKHDPSKKKNIGLLAEDVAHIYPELVVYDEEGKPFSICYKLLSVLLLSEVKNMNETIEFLKETIKTLKEQQI